MLFGWPGSVQKRKISLLRHLYGLGCTTVKFARNVYLERQRKRKKQVALKDVYSDPSPGPEKLNESRSQIKRVLRVLQTLPEIDRASFILRVHHELSYDEIARVLGLSSTAAKVKVYRVRKKLLATCIDKEAY